MLISFLISLVGHTLSHRQLEKLCQEFAISRRQASILKTSNLVFVVILAVLLKNSDLLWLFIGILLITLKFFPYIFKIFLERHLRSSVILILDMVVLGLQSGKSFRVSLRTAIENQRGWIRVQMMELYQAMTLSENVIGLKSALLEDLLLELREIDAAKNHCLEQVKALRRDLKTLENFRRRSGQVTQQLKMQAIIVTALFSALLSFVIMHFGFFKNKNLIIMSIGIFFSGLAWIFIMERRFKWKV